MLRTYDIGDRISIKGEKGIVSDYVVNKNNKPIALRIKFDSGLVKDIDILLNDNKDSSKYKDSYMTRSDFEKDEQACSFLVWYLMTFAVFIFFNI